MNIVHTGIAVALAVIVVGVIFVFPGLSPFGSSVAAPTDAMTGQLDTTTQNPSSMPTSSDQVQATDQTVGAGAAAAPGDTVTINYTGMLADGTVFDASAKHGQAFSFTLGAGQVIPGFDQGVMGMKEGGKRKVVIPPGLAYGAAGVPGVIPADATLIFEIELLKVQKGQ